MIEAGILASGGILVVEEIREERRWTDISVFECCLRAVTMEGVTP
jgi:hypothetical protein